VGPDDDYAHFRHSCGRWHDVVLWHWTRAGIDNEENAEEGQWDAKDYLLFMLMGV